MTKYYIVNNNYYIQTNAIRILINDESLLNDRVIVLSNIRATLIGNIK